MNKKYLIGVVAIVIIAIVLSGCLGKTEPPVSDSGIQKASVTVNPQSNGYTVEQNNVMERLRRDNKVGSIKHLYVISAYSGQVLIYSTVKGKVTSSGKRLTPRTVSDRLNDVGNGFPISFGGSTYYTQEVLEDDGTYGNSIEYLFWFDSKDIYHQHYVQGGQIVHISDQPLSVKSVILNMELVNSTE